MPTVEINCQKNLKNNKEISGYFAQRIGIKEVFLKRSEEKFG